MRTDSRPFWDDALNVILSQVPPAGLDFPASGTRASATDIPNVSLEWMVTPAYPNGAWFGHLGTHANQASLDAVPTIYLASGSTVMVAGISKAWNGTGWGIYSISPLNNLLDLTSPGKARSNLGIYPNLKNIFKSTAGNSVAIWGSSTMAYSTQDSTANHTYHDGLMFAAMAVNGSPISIAYNGAVGGTASSQIQSKFLAEVGSYTYDIAILQMGANDLPDGQTAEYVKGYTLPCILAALRLGKKIILVVPYVRNPNPVPHTEYRNYSQWCASMEMRFPGQVFVVDLWAAISPGTNTPAGYLDGSGIHVNSAGCFAAASAWANVFHLLFGVYDAEIDALGLGSPLVNPYAPPSGWSVTNVTESVGQMDALGRASSRLTCTADAAAFLYKDITSGISIGNTYRAFADVIVVNGGSLPVGCYFRAGDGSVVTAFGSGYRVETTPAPNGTRLRMMTKPIVATAAMAASSRLGIAFGGVANAVVDAFSCGVFQV